MSNELNDEGRMPVPPPVSAFLGPIAELVAHHLLAPPPRPGLLASLDGFEILRLLGSGGMGIVLLARDSRTGEEVAIKLIRPELATDSGMRHRFIKEAGHMQRLRHPSIVQVSKVSEFGQGPYFVMPYFKGGNLSARLASHKPLQAAETLDLALPLAEGLQFAHRRGIIHRDLKPGNVLLTAEGAACLADFGLARTVFNDTVVDPAIQQCEGTAPYMSPAVAAGDAEDTRCDIYAFGALLYEMLTGEPPYEGASTADVRKQILSRPPRPIKLLNPSADSGLTVVAEGAMGRELRDRYADMADVVQDLQRLREGKQPFGARGLTRRVRRKLSLKQGILVPVGLLLTGGAIIAAVVIWSARARHDPSVHLETVVKPNNPAVLHLRNPIGIVADRDGLLYVADSADAALLKISATGNVSVLAGVRGNPGMSDGSAANARFSILRGLTMGSSGDFYATDGYEIRTVTARGDVRTFAGLAGRAGAEDGRGRAARFRSPSGLATDKQGNLYVADMYTLRKISADGAVITLAGLDGHAGWTDGDREHARFGDQSKGIAVDEAGNIFVADSVNCELKKVTPMGTVTTIAGSFHAGFADGIGSQARFNRPTAVAVDRHGIAYIADTGNHAIRVVAVDGQVSTLAGQPGQAGNRDGKGSEALFDKPTSIAFDALGTIYVCDSSLGTIRKITPDGVVTTVTVNP